VPQLDGLPYADRVKLYERIVADDENCRAKAKAREMELRSSLEGSVPDILTSYQLSGGYNGQEPTPQDFDIAYGDNAAVKWSEFESSREAAKSVNHYKNMSANEISADLQSAQSQIPNGPGAEHAQKLFEARQSGADGVLKQRAADPAGYILDNFPDVKAAWDKPYDPEHPENFVPAMNMLTDREEQLGMIVMPLPKEYASKAVKLFKDENLPIDRRANAIASTILVTPDKKQRAAIFNQLVSVGLPERSMAAVDAYARGDSAGAARLFAAAALDAKDVPNLSEDRMAVLRKSLQDRMLDEGSRGNALYGLKYLNPANIQRATRDMALAETSVKMRIAAGEGDTEAIDGALKDIWGNVERMDINLPTGGAALGVVEAGTDQAQLMDGMEAVKPTIARAVEGQLRAGLGRLGLDANQLRAAGDHVPYTVKDVMASGAFMPLGDDWGFFDPYNNRFVSNAAGQPLVFSNRQLMQAIPQGFDRPRPNKRPVGPFGMPMP
jgi:hypothetical protein